MTIERRQVMDKVNATGPLEAQLRMKAKAELSALVAAIIPAMVDSVGHCTLPNGDVEQLHHAECTKRKGTWSPSNVYVGYGVGRGGGIGGNGEESPAHEASESPATESAEEGGGSAPSSGGASSSGGGNAGVSSGGSGGAGGGGGASGGSA